MPKRGRALGKRDKSVKSHSRNRREPDFRPTDTGERRRK